MEDSVLTRPWTPVMFTSTTPLGSGTGPAVSKVMSPAAAIFAPPTDNRMFFTVALSYSATSVGACPR